MLIDKKEKTSRPVWKFYMTTYGGGEMGRAEERERGREKERERGGICIF